MAGLENKYFFGKLERPWAHELTSRTGGELMSWSPSVSAALLKPNNGYGQYDDLFVFSEGVWTPCLLETPFWTPCYENPG